MKGVLKANLLYLCVNFISFTLIMNELKIQCDVAL